MTNGPFWSLGLEFLSFLKLSKGIQAYDLWPKIQRKALTFLEEYEFRSRIHAPYPTVQMLFIAFSFFYFQFLRKAFLMQC